RAWPCAVVRGCEVYGRGSGHEMGAAAHLRRLHAGERLVAGIEAPLPARWQRAGARHLLVRIGSVLSGLLRQERHRRKADGRNREKQLLHASNYSTFELKYASVSHQL